MWTPRTQAVKEGEKPFIFGIDSVHECTWFCYYEALWHSLSAPCWYEGSGSKGYGSYTDAKDWIECYRDPWIPITDPNYKPVQGDILVYDGEHGHVIFMETDTMTAEYRKGDPNSFRNAKLGDFKGKLLGVLHYPYQPVNTVERNENVNQIQTTDEALRIRTEPNLNGEIVGHVQIGYYNVLNQKDSDGYTWYEIEKDRWCADVTTKYLPASADDFVKKIEEYLNGLKGEINVMARQRDTYKERNERAVKVLQGEL